MPTPLGNIEDITLRALRVLEAAECIICEDTRVAKKLLALLVERHGIRSDAKELLPFHSHNEHLFLEKIGPAFFAREIAFLSDAGMPCISDPGAAMVQYCQDNGVVYTVLPGPSAVVTAYAASGFTAVPFLFAGFLPHKGVERAKMLQTWLAQPFEVVLYESPHRLAKLFEEIRDAAPQRRLFAAKELSKKHERYFWGTAGKLLCEITGTLTKGEWVVVIGRGEGRPVLPMGEAEILALDLPTKQKAKLLARVSDRSAKTWYRDLEADRSE